MRHLTVRLTVTDSLADQSGDPPPTAVRLDLPILHQGTDPPAWTLRVPGLPGPVIGRTQLRAVLLALLDAEGAHLLRVDQTTPVAEKSHHA